MGAFLATAGVLGTPAARADEQPYVHEGFVYRVTTAARYNPLGLSTLLRLGYREPLLGAQGNPVLQSTYVGANAVAAVTPSYARGGVRLDLQPLAIFQLTAAYEVIGYYGTFGYLQSYPSVSADFSDSAQSRGASAGRSYPATGQVLTLNPTLQGRVGRVAFASSTEFVHQEMNVRGGDTVFYDPYYAMLAPRAGWLVGNETDVVFAVTGHLNVGVRHAIYHAFLPDSAVAGDVARARQVTPIQYLGPLAFYSLARANGPSRYKNPAVFLIAGWWLKDPYRTGAEVSRAVPHVILGFTFEGEVLGNHPPSGGS
jgi:hypothetical protein